MPTPFCRVRGWGWVDVGVLCLSWWPYDSPDYPRHEHPNEDRHKAPSLPLIHPLSLQDGEHRLPNLVVNVHQGMPRPVAYDPSLMMSKRAADKHDQVFKEGQR